MIRESVKLTHEIDAGTKTIDSNLSKKELISIIIGCRPELKILAWNVCEKELTKDDLLYILENCRRRKFLKSRVILALQDLKDQLSEEDLRKIRSSKYARGRCKGENNKILSRDFPVDQDSLSEIQDLKLAKNNKQQEKYVGAVKLPSPEKKRETTLPGYEFVVRKKRREIGDWTPPWKRCDY